MWRKLLSSIHSLFNNPSVRAILTRARLPLGLVACVVLLTQVEREWFLPGLIVSSIGAVGQLWCFGCLEKRKVLAVEGPYCLSRNPMYLARYLLILGAVLLTGELWLALLFSVIYYFYMVNRVRREEKRLETIFTEDYTEYCSRVPRFLPSFRNVGWRRLWCFRWKTFLKNNGHINALGVIVFYGVSWLFTFPYRGD